MKCSLLAMVLLLSSWPIFSQSFLKANPDRMEQRIKALGAFGANPQGGVSRVAFSEADIQGREFIVGLMKSAGLTVRMDAAGNIIGRREGKNKNLSVIAFGSHIDSVPEGGNYDGDVGVIGALECIELLNAGKIQTDHPLEVIVFSDEEGGLTGSTAMIGHLKESDLLRVSNSGKAIGDGINFLGGNTSLLSSAIRKPGELLAFVELHIEQGGKLYADNINIGIVEGIVGIESWNIMILGKANHAGTTPMNMRQDALLAAARLVIAINETVRSAEGFQVGTVGRIQSEPGAVNVIPGKVEMSLELRDLSRLKIMTIFEKVKHRADSIAEESGTQIDFVPLNSNLPAFTDKRIQSIIAAAAKELKLTTRVMPSGAGHDSQDMAQLTPTAMIFVPSKDGISHSPEEYTSPQDMANGATLLLNVILKLDKSF